MAEIVKHPRMPDTKQSSRAGKLMFVLFFLFVTLLVVLFFRSPLSKIEIIEITGNDYGSEELIGQALGVHVGDQFFAVDRWRLEQRILLNVPIVESVKVRKSFPGGIYVHIDEYPQVAIQVESDGHLSAVLANGLSVPAKAERLFVDQPILSGWQGHDEVLKQLCIVLAELDAPMLSDISEIIADPTTSYPDRIIIYTRSHFQIITSVSYLAGKIEMMRTIVAEKEPGKVILLEADTHAPYHLEQNEGEGPAD